MYGRKLDFKTPKHASFFLWGLRQSGKSSLLKSRFPNSFRIDFLRVNNRLKYEQNPELLREHILAHPQSRKSPVILDEIQKIPVLLDEVHALIEDEKIQFALCGSSARKLKRGQANLLGGRAIRFELHGLSASEIGSSWSLTKMLNNGYLPTFYDSDNPRTLHRAYIESYLKEEVLEEGLVRRLPPFSKFLENAALSDTQTVSWESFAREVGVSSQGIKGYFEILTDTHVGAFLPSFQLRPKRRTKHQPKFYFNDVGLVNFLAKRGTIETGSELFGKAFENWIYHELSSYRSYKNQDLDLSYWALSSGIEVDFILNSGEVAIEAKGTSQVHSEHLKGLRSFSSEYPTKVKNKIIVSLDREPRKTSDGILILPYREFLNHLWSGKLIQ
jgi:predicted AAA+ superfamily ATPase